MCMERLKPISHNKIFFRKVAWASLIYTSQIHIKLLSVARKRLRQVISESDFDYGCAKSRICGSGTGSFLIMDPVPGPEPNPVSSLNSTFQNNFLKKKAKCSSCCLVHSNNFCCLSKWSNGRNSPLKIPRMA